MLIYIAGAGAMGCRFGAALHKAGQEVILLDNWADHVAAIREDGLRITGDVEEVLDLTIMRPAEASRLADVVILFTKANQLWQMLSDIQPILGPESKVLCLLNGLGHADTLAEFVPSENILMGVTVWTAGLKGPGQVELKGTGSLTIQGLGEPAQAFGREFALLLTQAGLEASYTEDVLRAIWTKAMVNGTMNASSALLDANLAQVFASPSGVALVRSILAEFIAVAAHEGLDFDLEETYSYIERIALGVGHHYPSMHQDLIQHKRLTEVDYLNGVIARKSAELGLSAPYCQIMTQLIHAREEINAQITDNG